MDDPKTHTLLRHIEAMGFAISRMTLLEQSGRRHRYTAWPEAANPDGIYRGGQQYVAEADSEYDAAVQLAQLVGVELEDG